MDVESAFKSAFKWVVAGERHGERLRIEGMRVVLEALGHPEKKLRFVHLAGTNGKGSIAAYVASILAAAGFKVGLFISPYLERFGERIRVLDGLASLERLQTKPDEGELSPEALVHWVDVLQSTLRDLPLSKDHDPTHFEILTLMSFLHFADQACDIVVLETGMGGTYDVTNVIPDAEVHIISTISYDHMAVLGHTIRSIAENKAGIIKGPHPVVLYNPHDTVLKPAEAATVLDVVETRAKEFGAPLEIVSQTTIQSLSRSTDGQTFLYKPNGEIYETRLAADVQAENAAMALAACHHLISEDELYLAAKRGIRLTRWPGRFETILEHPKVIIDGAHNPEATATFVRNLEELLPGKKLYTIVGLLKDKDYETMLKLYFKNPELKREKTMTLTPQNPRALDAKTLAEKIAALDPQTTLKIGAWDQLEQFIEEAIADEAIVVAWGSFYLIGPLKTQLQKGVTV